MSPNDRNKSQNLLRELKTLRIQMDAQQSQMDMLNRKLQHSEQQLLLHGKVIRKYRENLLYASHTTFSGEILTAIAHELRQRLAAITAYAQTGLRAIDMNNDVDILKFSLNNIKVQSLRAGDTLSAFRSIDNQWTLERVPTDMNSLIEQIPVLLRGDAEAYGIEIVLDLAPELPRVRVIEIQLQQVMLNLMLNAIEAIEAAGDTAGKKFIHIRSRLAGANHIRVSISDSGVGIDKRYEDEILSSYFSTKASGLGKGLSLCQIIITAHGGQLDINRRKTKGAEVYFTLPIESACKEEPSP